MTRWVSLLLLVVLAGLQVKLWVSGGMSELLQLQATVESQSEKNAAQRAKNARLAAEVLDLKQGDDAIEERARAELGMVKADEIFYQVIAVQDKPSTMADVSSLTPEQLPTKR